MTWEELVKKAKELGYDTYGVSNFKLQKDTDTKQIAFWDDGTINWSGVYCKRNIPITEKSLIDCITEFMKGLRDG